MSTTIPEGNLSPDDIRKEIERIQKNPDLNITSSQEGDNVSDKSKNVAKQESTETPNLEEMLENSEVFVEDVFTEATAILVFAVANGLMSVFTPGNLSVVSGKPKSGNDLL